MIHINVHFIAPQKACLHITAPVLRHYSAQPLCIPIRPGVPLAAGNDHPITIDPFTATESETETETETETVSLCSALLHSDNPLLRVTVANAVLHCWIYLGRAYFEF